MYAAALRIENLNVHAFAASNDGHRVAAFDGKTVQVWDVHTGNLLREKSLESPHTQLQFKDDDTHLALFGGQGEAASVNVWNMTDDTIDSIPRSLPTDTVIAISPDFQYLSVLEFKTYISVQSVRRYTEKEPFRVHKNHLGTGIGYLHPGKKPKTNIGVFTRDGNEFVCANDDETRMLLKLPESRYGWTQYNNDYWKQYKSRHGSTSCVAVEQLYDIVAMGTTKGFVIVKLDDVDTAFILQHVKERNPEASSRNTVVSVAFSHDGTRLISAGNDSHVIVWDVSISRLRDLKENPTMVYRQQHNHVSKAVFLGTTYDMCLSSKTDITTMLTFDQPRFTETIARGFAHLPPQVQQRFMLDHRTYGAIELTRPNETLSEFAKRLQVSEETLLQLNPHIYDMVKFQEQLAIVVPNKKTLKIVNAQRKRRAPNSTVGPSSSKVLRTQLCLRF